MKTGIIIPCYNEENRLDTNAFITFINAKNEFHLCFVNDGSKDDTIRVLKEVQETNPEKVSVIDMKKNGGKAAAVRAGARYLHSRGDIQFIGFIDADLSTDFEDFDGLVQTLQSDTSLNLVFGSRAKNASEGIEKNPLRALFSKMINILIVAILGLSIQDTQCGAKVFRAGIVPVLFNQAFLTRWLFDVEMFIRLKKHMGVSQVMNSIIEQPLKRWVHMDDSKLGAKDALEIPFRLASIWFNYTVAPSLNFSSSVTTTEPAIEIFGTPSIAIAA